MGANAQTSVPLFVANSVLTAAQQNISAATGVPVFATTATRDAAFGGSNKALAEGQLCYLEATDVVQYYTGSAWATVGPSTASGLTFIKSASIGSAVASVTVTNAFSATYDNYMIEMDVTTISGGATELYATINGSTGSTYTSKGIHVTTVVNVINAATTTVWDLGVINTSYGAVMNVRAPFLSTVSNLQNQFSCVSYGGVVGCVDTSTASSTNITFTPASGTITGGTIRVYGYANS